MQINRLFEIVYQLLDKKTVTAKELSEHFEVSIRTILRDIDVLSSAGIPIYTTQGKGGGISLLEGYVLNKAVFSEEEQSSILFALQGLGAVQNIETQSAIRKLKGMFERQNMDWIEIDFSRWSSRPEDKRNFELIKTALTYKQAIQFNYSNLNGQSSLRTVYPLKLLFKSMAWYLSAWCKQKEDYRVFKITRMKEIALLNEYVTDKALVSPPIEFDNPQHDTIELTLSLPAKLAYRVYDEFCEDEITKSEDGSFIIKATLPDEVWIFDYLLSFGSDVEVLDPPEMRSRMIELVQKILQNYSEQT